MSPLPSLCRRCSASRRVLPVTMLLAVLAGAVGCSGEATGPVTGEARVGALPSSGALVIEMDSDSLQPGASMRLALRDGAGRVVSGARWSSSDPVALVLSPDGIATAGRAGMVVVRATLASVVPGGVDRVATRTVRVVPPRAARLDVWPRELLLEPGRAASIAVAARTAAGDLIPDAQVRLAVATPGVAEVRGDGTLLALAVGETVVRVTVDGIAREVPMRVEAARTSHFDVAFRFGDLPAAHGATIERAATAAAQRWREVLVGDLAPVAVQLPANHCTPGSAAIATTVDDLLVLVTTGPVDGPGAVAALSWPCAVRASSRLPAVAVVRLDADDVAAIVADGLLEAVLAHELGHALGLGTLWNAGAPPLVVPTVGYGGDAARRAAVATGVIGTEASVVPVTWLPGSGQAHHWDEAHMAGELMTPFIDSPRPPISRVSAAALRDLGYEVAESAAASFVGARMAPPASTLGRAAAPRGVRHDGGVAMQCVTDAARAAVGGCAVVSR